MKYLKKIYINMHQFVHVLFPILNMMQKLPWIKKVRFGKNVLTRNTMYEGYNMMGADVIIQNSVVGKGSYVNGLSCIRNTKIGRFSSIADNVVTGFGSHPTSNFVTTYPAFYYNTASTLGFSYVPQGIELYHPYKYVDVAKKYVVEIGHEVWVGSHVLIMDGVKIGTGAIIAAGAVVTKDVCPYSIVGGVPAKLIKYRFEKEQIKFLLEFQWWNKDDDWLKEHYMEFKDIESFYAKYHREV